MAKVELKKPIIDEISNVIEGADSVVLVNYCGLNVDQDTKLRRTLREAGVAYKVYKNRMMNFAFQGTPCEPLCKHLESTNALAVSKDDATVSARLFSEFAKKNPQLELVAGVIEGEYYDADGLKALAQIPSREVLLGRLFGSMQSPIANLARVLDQIAEAGGGAAAAEAAPKAEEAPAEAAAEAPAAEEAPAEAAAEAPAAEEAPAEAAAEAPAAEEAPAE